MFFWFVLVVHQCHLHPTIYFPMSEPKVVRLPQLCPAPPTAIKTRSGLDVQVDNIPAGTGKKAGLFNFVVINETLDRVWCTLCQQGGVLSKGFKVDPSKASLSSLEYHLVYSHSVYIDRAQYEKAVSKYENPGQGRVDSIFGSRYASSSSVYK